MRLATKASVTPPPFAVWKPFTIGRFDDVVSPVRYEFPKESTAIAWAMSIPPPPRYVEKTSLEPVASSFVTYESIAPASAVWSAPAVVGKSVESVRPVTYALPTPSTAIAKPKSGPVPPRYVE